MSEQNQFNRQVHIILNELTEAFAQVGQALSVHLPNADIDHAASLLTKINSQLNTLEAFIND